MNFPFLILQVFLDMYAWPKEKRKDLWLKSNRLPDIVVQAWNLSTQETERQDNCEYHGHLAYLASDLPISMGIYHMKEKEEIKIIKNR